MIFKPYYLACLSHASYLVADEGTRTAAVVDPQRDVAQYLDDAKRLGVAIRHVFLTHFHADFVSGHIELAKATGAVIHVGARGGAEYDFAPAKDGDVVDLGRVSIRVLETPGHTPESVCYAIHDLDAGGDAPYAILTGDTLFLGDVGRPDLMASVGVSADELAGMLYDSLREKVLPLPDATLVYPAHGAGSLCGKNLSTEACTTLGVQRRTNPALQPMTKEAFVRLVTADQPEQPAYFGYDADLNRRTRATLDEALSAGQRPLSLDDVLALASGGATLLDTRSPKDFAAGHLAGSVNVGLGGKYATWAGTVLDRTKPIVIVASPGTETESAMRLGRIGFDRVVGHLAGGASAFPAAPDLLRRVRREGPAGLAARLGLHAPPLVLDVRTPTEFAAGAVPGAVNIPLSRLLDRLDEIPRDREVVVHCQAGYRSSIAVSLLQRVGFDDVWDVVGGYQAIEAAKVLS